MAALYGLQLARRMDYKKIQLEGDALNVVTALQKRVQGSSPIHMVYDCCFDELAFFDVTMITHVCRAGNTMAHMIARWTTDVNSEKVCMPPFSESLRTLEMLGLS